ncbi:MAG TPA: UbiA family prenyltransferase, partial [Nitrososphaerales archaeon]|nr:UbiA family prenyltransferase [Nitrososphaerales archaeon]
MTPESEQGAVASSKATAHQGTLASIAGLRAWKLALAGPAPYWYFPIFYALLSTRPQVSPLGLSALMVVMMLSASWGFLLNDLADREADSKGGRADVLHGHGLSRRVMWSLVLLTAAGSWVVVFLIGGGYAFKVVLALDYLIATLYSVRPVKLKVRRFWGFLANSLMERPLPIVVFLAYMNFYTAATLLFPVLMELSWSVFKHQAADVKEDLAANVMTFAASLGERLSNRIVMWFLNPLSVASMLFLVGLSWLSIPSMRLPLLATFIVIAVSVTGAFLAERAGKLTVYITPTDPPYIIALNLTYRYVVLVVLGY